MSTLSVQNRMAGTAAEPGVFEKVENLVSRIRDRAYELFELRGGLHGHHEDDWCQAELELFEVPKCELVETPNGYEARLEMPGFRTNEISICIDEGMLTVHAQAERRSSSNGKAIVSEMTERETFRRLALPEGVNLDAITARLSDGLLTVKIPRLAVEAESEQSVPAETAATPVPPTKVEAKPKAKAASAVA